MADVRDITAEVLSANPGRHTAVEILDIIKRKMSVNYRSLLQQYDSDAKIEDVIYSQAVRAFQEPATTRTRDRLKSDYAKGRVAGKRIAKFWIRDSEQNASLPTADYPTPSEVADRNAHPDEPPTQFDDEPSILTSSIPEPQPLFAADLDTPPAERVAITVSRIVRDTKLAAKVKAQHEMLCQLCGQTVTLADNSRYAEGHHLQPLGAPHNGPDIAGNIVCLCPNHHAACDLGAIRLTAAQLRSVKGHVVEQQFLDYHNRMVYRGVDTSPENSDSR